MPKSFLGLGSNIGERIAFIEKAVKEICKIPGLRLINSSSVYETDPWGKEVLVNETINVPHRQIENRKFVLIPLAEIAPEFIHPVFKKTISELLEHTTDKLNVVRYQTSKV